MCFYCIGFENFQKFQNLTFHNKLVWLLKKSIKIDFYRWDQFYRLSIRILIYRSLSIFWKFAIFWRHLWQFFRERMRLAPKINITFFITNEVPNTLLFSSFFQNRLYFLRKLQNHSFWGPSLFPRGGGVKSHTWI